MIINGVELDFNLYDAENTEMQKRYEAELFKMQNIAEEQEQIQGAAEQTRFLCQRIKTMFLEKEPVLRFAERKMTL